MNEWTMKIIKYSTLGVWPIGIHIDHKDSTKYITSICIRKWELVG